MYIRTAHKRIGQLTAVRTSSYIFAIEWNVCLARMCKIKSYACDDLRLVVSECGLKWFNLSTLSVTDRFWFLFGLPWGRMNSYFCVFQSTRSHFFTLSISKICGCSVVVLVHCYVSHPILYCHNAMTNTIVLFNVFISFTFRSIAREALICHRWPFNSLQFVALVRFLLISCSTVDVVDLIGQTVIIFEWAYKR